MATTIAIRIACFVAAGASGAALLAKVYGITTMRLATLAIALPCTLALVVLGVAARHGSLRSLSEMIAIGALGGLLGTIAYDLVRVPFDLLGQRIFAPISAYGVWIADARASSGFTEAIGWSYHFWNGIAFGVMYALFMRGRPWFYAVLWGLVLETIAVVSPFARIFSLAGDYSALGIAYLGHVAYGIPLGLVVQEWDGTRAWIARVPAGFWWSALLVGAAVLSWPLLDGEARARDSRVIAGTLLVEGSTLNPDWIRIDHRKSLKVANPGPNDVLVRVRDSNIYVASHSSVTVKLDRPGIVRAFVETDRRPHSSFVIAEPVEHIR